MINRDDILKYVYDNYNTSPEKPWSKYPNNEILRHASNNKWYGLIMRISKDKIGPFSPELVDIINLKCNPDMASVLALQNGIFEAYHMNKKHWITIILDGTVSDEEIYNLIDNSYELTQY